MSLPNRVLLAHGAGGRLTRDLVQDLFLPAFRNAALAPLSDAALLPDLPAGRLALTTDAFVVDPVVFPGGDLGYLSVCGTVNDLAVAGAIPRFLTWALILEEGLDGPLLETFVAGARRAAEEAEVEVVAGDTKVVPRGKGDRAFVVTSGVGTVPRGRDVGDHRVLANDVVLVSGNIGDHGATILANRHGLEGQELRSDCAPLTAVTAALFASGVDVHAMHDPTRGGVATTCNEVAGRAEVRIVLDEAELPFHPATVAVSELLGMDPLYLACEGRALIWVAEEDADRALTELHSLPAGRDARRIGTVLPRAANTVPVTRRTRLGVERPLDMLSGLDLPRIC